MTESAAYISSDQRERARLFDDTIERAQRAISALAIANTFPADKLAAYRADINGLFLPNVTDDGIVSIPRARIETEDIPLLVTGAQDETVYHIDATFREQTPLQVQNTVGLYQQEGGDITQFLKDKALIQANIKANPHHVLPDHADSQMYAISYIAQHQKLGIRWEVMSRPMIKIRDVDSSRPARSSGLYHELVHKNQFICTPAAFDINDATRRDDRLSRELEAYDKQSKFDTALIATGLPEYTDAPHYALSFKRASVVELNPADDPYAASDVVKQAIIDRDLTLVP